MFSLAGVTFTGLHGRLMLASYDAPRETSTFAGAVGEVELRDRLKGRLLMIPYRVTAPTLPELQEALETLHRRAGQLHGDLVIDARTYRRVTFIAFRPSDPRVIYDPAGDWWILRGTILLRQLAPA